MKKRMRSLLGNLLIFNLFLFFCLVPLKAGAAAFDAAAMKNMSVFLSNFTEVGMMNFEAGKVLDLNAPRDMIHFGIRHNYINNYQGRVAQCVTPNCQWGTLTMKGEYVKDSLKRYFDYDLPQFPTVESFDLPYHFDGESYHFAGADGETIYYARVDSAQTLADGNIQMQGVVYNADNESDVRGSFTALAKPHIWKGNKTWAILSLKTEFGS